MARIIESDVQLLASMRLSERFLLAVQVRHGATLQVAVAGRRAQRVLRSRAMMGLAVAWSDPAWRQRWRAAGR